MKNKYDDYYSTSDLALASILVLWYPLEEINWSENPHKAKFVFKKDSKLDQLVNSYYRGELSVNPQEYFNALKSLKARLYANR